MKGQAMFLTVLREFAASFESAKRDSSGERFYRVKESAPGWMQGSDVMREIHQSLDGRMPDDWVYESAASIASTLADYSPSDADSAREHVHEIADGLVDVYNSARLQWLASHSLNAELVDDGCAELGCSESLVDRIGVGQYHGLTLIAYAVISACESEADDRELADESEDESDSVDA